MYFRLDKIDKELLHQEKKKNILLEGLSSLAALTSNVDPDAETILEFDLSEESVILGVYQTLDEDSIQIIAKDLK